MLRCSGRAAGGGGGVVIGDVGERLSGLNASTGPRSSIRSEIRATLLPSVHVSHVHADQVGIAGAQMEALAPSDPLWLLLLAFSHISTFLELSGHPDGISALLGRAHTWEGRGREIRSWLRLGRWMSRPCRCN